jgi:DNA excision repair protein ERCC-3
LKNNTFYVESPFPDVLRELLKNPTILRARITDVPITEETQLQEKRTADGFVESSAPKEDRREVALLLLGGTEGEEEDGDDGDDDGLDGIGNGMDKLSHISSVKTVSFMVSQSQVQVI